VDLSFFGYFLLLHPFAWPLVFGFGYLYHLIVNGIAFKAFRFKKQLVNSESIKVPRFSLFTSCISGAVLFVECGLLFVAQVIAMIVLLNDRVSFLALRFGDVPWKNWRMFLIFIPIYCFCSWMNYKLISRFCFSRIEKSLPCSESAKLKDFKIQSARMCGFISLLTAPWIVLVPVLEILWILAAPS
jgi:hypothetical protein